MSGAKAKIEKNLQRIRERIASACSRSARQVEDVTIIAVTKTVDADTIRLALEAGLTDLGENRVQQLVDRSREIDASVRRRRPGEPAPKWHMIGSLQRNKVKTVLEVGATIHSVDSLRLAEEINSRAERSGVKADVLLEINCSQEPQKHGVAVGAAAYLGELVGTMKHLRLMGLMTMAPLVSEPEQARPSFVRLRELFEEMRREGIGGDSFRHLSMGMSQDYVVAVEEGATVLRIGTALFE